MKNGIAASKGYAIGKVFIQQHEEIVITDEKVTDVAAAKEELNKALEASKVQLEAIKAKTLEEIGEHEAQVFAAHLELLDDPGFAGEMERKRGRLEGAVRTGTVGVRPGGIVQASSNLEFWRENQGDAGCFVCRRE